MVSRAIGPGDLPDPTHLLVVLRLIPQVGEEVKANLRFSRNEDAHLCRNEIRFRGVSVGDHDPRTSSSWLREPCAGVDRFCEPHLVARRDEDRECLPGKHEHGADIPLRHSDVETYGTWRLGSCQVLIDQVEVERSSLVPVLAVAAARRLR